MKDYTFGKMGSAFILHYDVFLSSGKKSICVNYADGMSEVIDYSLENEKNILVLMKEQIQRASCFKNSIEENLNDAKLNVYLSTGFMTVSTILNILASLYPNSGLCSSEIFMLTSLTSYYFGNKEAFKYFKYKSTLTDIMKNAFFIQNEEKLNEGLNKYPDLLKSVSKMIAPDCHLDCNNIRFLSYKSLKMLLDAITIMDMKSNDGAKENDLNKMKG